MSACTHSLPIPRASERDKARDCERVWVSERERSERVRKSMNETGEWWVRVSYETAVFKGQSCLIAFKQDKTCGHAASFFSSSRAACSSPVHHSHVHQSWGEKNRQKGYELETYAKPFCFWNPSFICVLHVIMFSIIVCGKALFILTSLCEWRVHGLSHGPARQVKTSCWE